MPYLRDECKYMQFDFSGLCICSISAPISKLKKIQMCRNRNLVPAGFTQDSIFHFMQVSLDYASELCKI